MEIWKKMWVGVFSEHSVYTFWIWYNTQYNIRLLGLYLFIYLFKNSTQYKQYKIEDTIKVVEF